MTSKIPQSFLNLEIYMYKLYMQNFDQVSVK